MDECCRILCLLFLYGVVCAQVLNVYDIFLLPHSIRFIHKTTKRKVYSFVNKNNMFIIFMYKVYIYINISMWNIHVINIFPLIHLFGIQQFTLSAVIFMAVQLFCKFNKNLSPLQQKLIGKIIMWPNVWWGHHILDWYCWGPDVTTGLNRAKAGSVILMLRKPYWKKLV